MHQLLEGEVAMSIVAPPPSVAAVMATAGSPLPAAA
jgi:hypothetical protein